MARQPVRPDVLVKPFPRGFPHRQEFTAVAGLVRDRRGRILLVRHGPGTPWRGRWATPGGLVRPKEGPVTALLREVREECGVRLRRIVLRRIVVMRDRRAKRTSLTLIFVASVVPGSRPKAKRGDPVLEARWFERLPAKMAFRDEYADL